MSLHLQFAHAPDDRSGGVSTCMALVPYKPSDSMPRDGADEVVAMGIDSLADRDDRLGAHHSRWEDF